MGGGWLTLYFIEPPSRPLGGGDDRGEDRGVLLVGLLPRLGTLLPLLGALLLPGRDGSIGEAVLDFLIDLLDGAS